MAEGDDNALGAYLKDRRKKLDPAAFGFSSVRRRTPGLRREEVAQRANVSATWYTWLEQGRGGAPSADVLDRLARALALSDVEREHLYVLALGHPPEMRRAGAGGRDVTPQLQSVLDGFESHPALLATSTWDIVAWNRAATIVLSDYGAIPVERRNTLKLMFTPGARDRMADWEHHARAVVASFRAQTARMGTTERAALLIDELSRSSPEFTAMWREHDVAALGPGRKRIMRGGASITLDYSSFAVHGHVDLHMIVYTPATPAGYVVRVRRNFTTSEAASSDIRTSMGRTTCARCQPRRLRITLCDPMTRTPRKFLPGRLYHLISRFVDREWFISTESEREHYLRLLGRALDTTDWRCLAYAVMSNHIHLAMIAGSHTLASWLRRVHSPFADAMNKTYERIGQMFVRGPKDVLTPHARTASLIAYIHNNPVRAGIVSDASQTAWTSHRSYIGDAPVPRWLHVNEGLQLAAATRAEFDQLVRTAPSAIDSDEAHALELEFEPPDVCEETVCVDDVVELTAVEVGLSPADIRSRRKQPSHVLARRVASRCGDRLGASGTQIARALGTTAQCVSKILLRNATDEVERHLVERVLRQVGDRAVNASRKL